MKIECPACKKEIDVTHKLPERACDDEVIECGCGEELTIGWYATTEVRSHRPAKD